MSAQDSSGLRNEPYVDLLLSVSKKYRFRQPDSVLIYAQKALGISKKLNYKKGELLALNGIAGYYTDIGDNENASRYYNRINELIKQEKDDAVKVEFYKTFAIQSIISGNEEKALELSFKAINICKKRGFAAEEATIRHNLGYMYTGIGMYSEADVQYHLADSLHLSINNFSQAARSKSNIALNALKVDNFLKAKTYAFTSLKQFISDNDPLWSSRSYRSLGNYYLKINSLDSAAYYTFKSDSILKLTINPYDWVLVGNLLSKINLKRGDLACATFYADSTQKLASQLKDTSGIIESLQTKFKIAMKNNATKKALEYKLEAEKLSNKLDYNRRIVRLGLIKTNLDLKSQEELIALENERIKSQNQYVKLASFFLLIIIIGIGIIFYNKILAQLKKQENLVVQNTQKAEMFSKIGKNLESPIENLKVFLSNSEMDKLNAEQLEKTISDLKQKLDKSETELTTLLHWAKSNLENNQNTSDKVEITSFLSKALEEYSKLPESISFEFKVLVNNITLELNKKHLALVLKNTLKIFTEDALTSQKLIIEQLVENNKLTLKFYLKNLITNHQQEKAINQKIRNLDLNIIGDLTTKNNGEILVDYHQKAQIKQLRLKFPMV